MSPANRTRSRLGPLSRRANWTAGGAIASLALVLAAGLVSPVGVAAQSMGERVSVSSGPGGGDDKCRDGSGRSGKGAAGLALGGDGWGALAAVERLAAGEPLALRYVMD
ncbi:hypothetical protein ACH492_01805 [Streptomyces sp. NPDC019443]|uniref:hypothetical protein n=1 Tax=Streptomyces sp. NPDC019443 TaxID=3365061 RepID=UPI0037997B42